MEETSKNNETAQLGIGAVSSRFAVITYLVYIIIWEAMVLGGFGYVVFGLDKSGWWMLLAVLMSASAYKPKSWSQLLNGYEQLPCKYCSINQQTRHVL